jgi:hypothetical protein
MQGVTQKYYIQIQDPQGLSTNQAGCPFLKATYKAWMSNLNQWVVRIESLKKYKVDQALGVGGQAIVYKIFKKNKQLDGESQISNPNDDSIPLAIKVVNKSLLKLKSSIE